MRRRLFAVISAVSLLLCFATAGLWVSSRTVPRSFLLYGSARDVNRPRMLALRSHDGFITFYWVGRKPPAPLTTLEGDVLPRNDLPWVYPRLDLEHNFNWLYRLGFGYASARGDELLRNTNLARVVLLGMPHWFVAGMAMVLPTYWFRRLRVLHRQTLAGCTACHYDLTGNTSGICPECGTPVPKEAAEKSPRPV